MLLSRLKFYSSASFNLSWFLRQRLWYRYFARNQCLLIEILELNFNFLFIYQKRWLTRRSVLLVKQLCVKQSNFSLRMIFKLRLCFLPLIYFIYQIYKSCWLQLHFESLTLQLLNLKQTEIFFILCVKCVIPYCWRL